jgi:hypothetical protein
MVEKINFAGLNENAFGDSDFIFMRQTYQGAEKHLSPSCSACRSFAQKCARSVTDLLVFSGNSEEASVRSGACSRSEKYRPLGEKFERNG